jgi:uncharacterized membrane protein
MDLLRTLKHLLLPDQWLRKDFESGALDAIEAAIRGSEIRHDGELRFVIEATLPLGSLLSQQTARERALDLFSALRVWDTEHNSGVLIYVQLLDRRVEIVADRGINARVAPDYWQAVCARMESAFRAGRFAEGALAAVSEVTDELTRHFPAHTANPNELPDRPLML